MGSALAYLGYANFISSLPADEVANRLSSELFGGIRFLEFDADEEYDVGRLYLERDFMGILVNLLTGDDGRFSIEVGTAVRACVKERVPVCDLSEMLKKMLANIPDITVVEGFPDDVVDD